MEEEKNKISFLKKKLNIRKKLAENGTLIKEGVNNLDGYTYFSEAQYKKLFSEYFAAEGLDLNANTLSITETKGPGHAAFGRRVEVAFTLTDTDTGYSETMTCFGEAFDRGDKAIYKAYTGAIKYYLANNWMVVTGDDPENEKTVSSVSSENKIDVPDVVTPVSTGPKATTKQLDLVQSLYSEPEILAMIKRKGYGSINDFTIEEASQMIDFKKKAKATQA